MAFESLTNRLQQAMSKIRRKGKVSEADVKEMMREIRLALLEADVNLQVVKDFTKRVRERAVGVEVLESLSPAQQIVKIVDEELTRGYFGARKNVWTVAKNTWEKGLTYAFRDRRNKKRNFRALWIQRINAAARLEGMSYSKLMGGLHKAGIEINRKVLADLAMNHPEAFKAVVAKAKAA